MSIERLQKHRQKLVNLKLPRFLNSIDSVRQLLLWLFAYFGIGFIVVNLINLFRGIFPSHTFEDFIRLLWVTILLGVVEEGVFRGFTRLTLGNFGLLVGTLIWIGFHQFNATPPPLYRIPTDMLFGIFYLKVWRGKYWWTSFIIHPLWNIGILVWWQLMFPLFGFI